MGLEEILRLMERFQELGLGKMKLETEEIRLVLEKEAPRPKGRPPMRGPHPAHGFLPRPCPGDFPDMPPRPMEGDRGAIPQPAAPAEPATEVRAPLVGTFYLAPAPGEPPFAQVGQQVKKGETLAVIEAMKMMNELAAPVDGAVRSIEAADGEMVEFGQLLLTLKEEAFGGGGDV